MTLAPSEGLETRRRSELDKVLNVGAKGAGDPTENVDTDIGASRLNPPEIGAAGSSHERKTALGNTLTFALGLDGSAEAFLFTFVLHPLNICLL